jgi:hypothetical protein
MKKTHDNKTHNRYINFTLETQMGKSKLMGILLCSMRKGELYVYFNLVKYLLQTYFQ